MIKTRINNEYKDIIKIFSGGTLQKEITKVWSGEASKYVYESEVEYTGALPITITADGNALIDYCIYGNTEWTGTPTPESPVDVMGCGVRTENFAPFIDAWGYGYVTDNGGIYDPTDRKERYSPRLTVEPGATYQIDYQTGSFPSADNSDWYKQSWIGIGWYNDDGFIRRTIATNVTRMAVVAPANAKYMILSFRSFGENYNCMITKASIPPDTYIPYGYKLPMVSRTENLFDVSAYSVGSTTFITKRITLEPNTTYTMSSNCPLYNAGALIAIGNVNESFTTAKNGVYPNHPISRTTDANGELVIGLRTNGSDYMPADYDTMLNLGSTALPYEPYHRTVTNIYLGEVETTRRIKKLALDGTELWIKSSSGYNAFYFYMTGEYPHPKINSSEVICNIATFTRIPDNYIRYPWFCVSDSSFCISTDSAVIGGAEVADWKSYLAAQYANGTPVTIWYVLAEPETGVVNEPLMKIGNYVDTLSTEQAGASIPTNKGSTVIDYDGEPKPSQMYIKYRR